MWGPKEPYVRWGPGFPTIWGTFRGHIWPYLGLPTVDILTVLKVIMFTVVVAKCIEYIAMPNERGIKG